MSKRFMFILLLVFIIPISVNASKEKVTLSKCVDGDTARFIYKGEEIKVRFLGINAPEIEGTNKEAEPYGEEAKNYVCRKLKKAEKIEIEYDENSDKKDKYDRYLAYVFLDGKLLETDILSNGYASVKYVKSNYKYYDELIKAENKAKEKKVGIHSDKVYKEESFIDQLADFISEISLKLVDNIFDIIFN